jgi:hypothetical protein
MVSHLLIQSRAEKCGRDLRANRPRPQQPWSLFKSTDNRTQYIRVGCGYVGSPWFEHWLCHLLALCLWQANKTPLSFSFLTYEKGQNACDPSTQEAEAGGHEFKARLNYIVRSCLKKREEAKKNHILQGHYND